MKSFKSSTALGLAHVCSPGDLKKVFIDNNGIKFDLVFIYHGHVSISKVTDSHFLYSFEGLSILLDLFTHGNTTHQRFSSVALLKLDEKADGSFFAKVDHQNQKV